MFKKLFITLFSVIIVMVLYGAFFGLGLYGESLLREGGTILFYIMHAVYAIVAVFFIVFFCKRDMAVGIGLMIGFISLCIVYVLLLGSVSDLGTAPNAQTTDAQEEKLIPDIPRIPGG
ncbi:MAG: hypothetical protein K8S27_09420 [Candidatus Omnitrophica bacterium]|nr:hypothetical protein [Candidatus Omnitrophota bacterium]